MIEHIRISPRNPGSGIVPFHPSHVPGSVPDVFSIFLQNLKCAVCRIPGTRIAKWVPSVPFSVRSVVNPTADLTTRNDLLTTDLTTSDGHFTQ